ncbi:MAG TPA: RidA family protein [Acetobacteraceae bacterium]
MPLTVLQPPGWPRPKGYSNAIIGSGRLILVSGMVGWDSTGRFAQGFVAQTRMALENILAVLAEAGAGPQHIARLTWYVTDMDAYRTAGPDLGAAWRAVMGRHYPAMAVIGVAGLVEREALVEIAAEAILDR